MQKNKHRLLIRIIRPALEFFFIKYFNLSIPNIDKLQKKHNGTPLTPTLILTNHTTDFDPIFIGLTTKRRIRYVASDHLMHKPLAYKALKYFFDPIFHHKGKQGINTIKHMTEAIKNGETVFLAAEGNRSFNGETMEIAKATAKMVKACRAEVMTIRIKGGYFTQPRWGVGLRRGKIDLEVVNIYTSEELKSMKVEDIHSAITKDLYENAYETQKANPIRYRGKNLAEAMESTIFMCPKCHRIGSLKSCGNNISCTCGYGASYDEYGNITSKEQVDTVQSVLELDRLQRVNLSQLIHNKEKMEETIFVDKVKLQEYCTNQRDASERMVEIVGRKDAIIIDGKMLHAQDIQSIAIYGRNNMIIYYGGDDVRREIRGDKSFSALKYLYWWQILRGECGD